MLRHFIVTVGLLIVACLVQAGEAGRIVFVTGQAHVADRAIALGDSILEGDKIATGADGYIYLKTTDDGFLILRPNSVARIATYHIDTKNSANTHVKLELLSGVARTISGHGVKQARQNFRFNTPVAAIGVRGTDFTVFTDQETSRVAVISGGVVVSGFSGACGPEGSGPCEGGASLELFAKQVGQLLQIRKGQAAPQLLSSHGLSPDLNAPARPDEPSAKADHANLGAEDISLDAQKSANLLQLGIPPPVVAPPPPVVVVEPARQIIWGRWQSVLGHAPAVDIVKTTDEKGQLLALNSYFAVLRSQGADWLAPTQGTAGFSLKQSEAYIRDESANTMSAALLENGKLQVDFAKSVFSTSFDLLSQKNERFKFQATGDVGRDGQLFGGNQFLAPNNMTVSGVVGPENGLSAAYIFQGRLDSSRMAVGATYWNK